MKPEEIKKGLECCNHEYVDCHNCPYNEVGEGWACVVERNADALDYIQQLEAALPKWISVEEIAGGKRRGSGHRERQTEATHHTA